MLSSTCGEAAFSETTFHEWVQRFKSGDFDLEDRHNGGEEKIIEDFEFEALIAEVLQRHNRKGFLHRIVTGDEKRVH